MCFKLWSLTAHGVLGRGMAMGLLLLWLCWCCCEASNDCGNWLDNSESGAGGNASWSVLLVELDVKKDMLLLWLFLCCVCARRRFCRLSKSEWMCLVSVKYDLGKSIAVSVEIRNDCDFVEELHCSVSSPTNCLKMCELQTFLETQSHSWGISRPSTVSMWLVVWFPGLFSEGSCWVVFWFQPFCSKRNAVLPPKVASLAVNPTSRNRQKVSR